ncbi:MAG: T9SS type A sorting domain-containing protein [Flavobacteriales bacterium]|nr:T9SS type A sorting domain-containing protein [Flavobacteriales bacterium]
MRSLLLTVLLGCSQLVQAQWQWDSLPPNIYPDSLHAPFILGVASNEPSANEVSIWSFAQPPGGLVNYEMATDSLFSNMVTSGQLLSADTGGFTVQTRIGGLQPDTYYWYRFSQNGQFSVTGRTRTLPTQTDRLRFAVTSCSSVWSGYFNAYRRMAQRTDLNAVIHLGDFIYDFVDPDERERVPVPEPIDVACGLDERRKRYFYYMLDPDQRLVRQQHPFIQIWDNHDVELSETPSGRSTCYDAFREWTAMPVFDTQDSARLYRKISLGPLADLFMIDTDHQFIEDSIAPNETSYLGTEQFNWLLNELDQSTAKWKLVANQKMFAPFSIQGLEQFIPNAPTDGHLTNSAWDGHPLERQMLLQHLADNQIDNVMLLSGDMHFSLNSDLPIDPFDSLSYDPETGGGSMAVEFLPTSISRGNLDEKPGIDSATAAFFAMITDNINPHHIYTQLTENGYGIIDLNSDSITADIWFSKIRWYTEMEELASHMVLKDGENHWSRNSPNGIAEKEMTSLQTLVYPNPATDQVTLECLNPERLTYTITIMDASGRPVRTLPMQGSRMQVNTSLWPSGMYFYHLTANGRNSNYRQATGRFVVEHH